MKKIIFLKLMALLFLNSSCSSTNKADQDNSALPPRINPDSPKLSLDKAFQSAEEPSLLKGKRTLIINSNSKILENPDNPNKGRPFVYFIVGDFSEKASNLIIESQGYSEGIDGIRIGIPIFYLKSENSIHEIKAINIEHESEFGNCLTAKYFFKVESIKKGDLILIANDTRGFNDSLGKVQIDNPNFELKKSVGFCSMMSVYPAIYSEYVIYFK